jgi:hypothetical protein
LWVDLAKNDTSDIIYLINISDKNLGVLQIMVPPFEVEVTHVTHFIVEKTSEQFATAREAMDYITKSQKEHFQCTLAECTGLAFKIQRNYNISDLLEEAKRHKNE